MKKVLAVLLMLMMILSLVPASMADATVKIATLKGPTAMGMVQMMDNNSDEYEFTIAGAVDEISPLLLKGEVDIAAIPANLSANLFQKTEGDMTVLAINTLGVLYIVENGSTVTSVEDLRGRTIFASGKGATPEYALNYILSGNGLDPENDVTIEWKSEHSECLAALLNTEGAVAMLPQPFVTTAQMKNETVSMVLDLNNEWAALQDGQEEMSALLTGVVVARTAFVEEHPELVNEFLDRYAASVSYTTDNIDEAAELIEKYGIIPAAVARKAIPYCCIVCIEGEEMKAQLSGYLKVLFDQNPAAVGGAMPEDGFYYSR